MHAFFLWPDIPGEIDDNFLNLNKPTDCKTDLWELL